MTEQWRQICKCGHSAMGHAVDGKGKCRICKTCAKFKQLNLGRNAKKGGPGTYKVVSDNSPDSATQQAAPSIA